MTDEAKPSRQRRRRSKDVTYDETKEGERKDDPDSGSAEAKPRPSKSGWGMTSSSNEPRSGAKADSIESVGAGRRRANFGSTGSSSSTARAHAKNRHFDEDDETSEVMEIPDLEEEDVEEDITAQVAEAPRNITRTVPTMKELNQRIKYSLPSAPANGLDLSILTSALYPLMTVFEEDKVWDFDNLLHDVAQEIQKTVDEKEQLKQQLELNPAATMYT